MSHVDY